MKELLKKFNTKEPEELKKHTDVIYHWFDEYFKPGEEKNGIKYNTNGSFYKLKDNEYNILTYSNFDQNIFKKTCPKEKYNEIKNKLGIEKDSDFLENAIAAFLIRDQMQNDLSKINKYINDNGINKVFLVGRDPVYLKPNAKHEVIGFSSHAHNSKFYNGINNLILKAGAKNFDELSKYLDKKGVINWLGVDPNNLSEKDKEDLKYLMDVEDRIEKAAEKGPVLIQDSAYVGTQPILFKKLVSSIRPDLKEKIYTGLVVSSGDLSRLHNYVIYKKEENGSRKIRDLYEENLKPITSYLKINEPRCVLTGEVIKSKNIWKKTIDQKIMDEYKKVLEKIEKNKKEKGAIYLNDVGSALPKYKELQNNIQLLSSFAIGIKASDIAHKKGDIEKGLDKFKKDYEKLFSS